MQQYEIQRLRDLPIEGADSPTNSLTSNSLTPAPLSQGEGNNYPKRRT
jgi:hypothetical protein